MSKRDMTSPEKANMCSSAIRCYNVPQQPHLTLSPKLHLERKEHMLYIMEIVFKADDDFRDEIASKVYEKDIGADIHVSRAEDADW